MREGAGGAEEDGELVVEVVAEPSRHARAGLQAECFPGVPEGGEADDGFGVAPPLAAPAVFAAEAAAERGQELADDPFLDPSAHRLGAGRPASPCFLVPPLPYAHALP